ncbi:hypothetical protein L227DRAFT_572223 [Lentinus tigrinus ALCF2SS1-6]|uniref:Uncharacterized protein n=1 Tax=Lentinus tigrinus ALCF2SS1-6 TaxID=1328759 RepID=A0A5C2SJ86_9APHY|nr:hypothetical protein L227DRAFT_572223 [Lentinus tigrinus ALCF2SS1-6]
MKYFQRPTSKAVDDGSVFSHGRAVVDHRRTHRSYRSTPRNVLAPTDPNSSACHITPALRVTPIAINTPSWNGDHTNRRIFGVPISAQGFGRVPSGLDDLDDGTYLRDALGLIDWSDVPPQCGYWPTLDADFQGEDEVRPYTPWYMADEDLRGWVFPAGRVRPDRSEPDELSVAGEG